MIKDIFSTPYGLLRKNNVCNNLKPTEIKLKCFSVDNNNNNILI